MIYYSKKKLEGNLNLLCPSAQGPDVPPATLSAVYLSLVQKHPTSSHSHTHLLLWLLSTVTEHLGIPEHLQTCRVASGG